jgi:hypothetical protein
MERRALGAAALLGVGLAFVWFWALGHSHTSWLNWTVAATSFVTLAGLVPATMDTIAGIATWPLAGSVLLAAWLFGLATGAAPWLAWACFAFGCAFVGLTFAYTIKSSHLGLLHRHRTA